MQMDLAGFDDERSTEEEEPERPAQEPTPTSGADQPPTAASEPDATSGGSPASTIPDGSGSDGAKPEKDSKKEKEEEQPLGTSVPLDPPQTGTKDEKEQPLGTSVPLDRPIERDEKESVKPAGPGTGVKKPTRRDDEDDDDEDKSDQPAMVSGAFFTRPTWGGRGEQSPPRPTPGVARTFPNPPAPPSGPPGSQNGSASAPAPVNVAPVPADEAGAMPPAPSPGAPSADTERGIIAKERLPLPEQQAGTADRRQQGHGSQTPKTEDLWFAQIGEGLYVRRVPGPNGAWRTSTDVYESSTHGLKRIDLPAQIKALAEAESRLNGVAPEQARRLADRRKMLESIQGKMVPREDAR